MADGATADVALQEHPELAEEELAAKKMMQSPDMAGVVLKGFVRNACGDEDLLAWAGQLCGFGEVAGDVLGYYEGYKAEAGESFSQQLQRQLEEDLRGCGELLLEHEKVARDSDLAAGSPSAAKALFKLFQRLMQLHEDCTEMDGGEELFWKIKIEINQNGACTKFHDDLVKVRFAITLTGDGTVLSDAAKVDWQFFESCGGVIGALGEKEDLAPAEASAIIQDWNQQLSKGEVPTGPGDLAIMKGKKLTNQPCLHRAPYSAGEGMQPARLLITMDRIPRDELQEFVEMDLGGSSGDEAMDHARTVAPGELLPVTVLSGFLGAGKTSLLTHVLQNQDGLRVAVIVNDMAEVNVDAMLVKSSTEFLTSKDKMVEMQNGCICCTLREDLIQNVAKLAAEKRFDYLLIESTGISEPMPVATTFAAEHEGKLLLGTVARLDTLVTVVDAANFMKEYRKGETLAERPALGAEEGDARSIAQLLVDQVECANVILLNKTDLVKESAAANLESLLRRLNPKAKIVRSSYGKVDLKLLLNTGSFNMEEAEQMPGWFQELKGNHMPETQEYNISSFVFRAQRPFHPKRLDKCLSAGFEGALRSKGLLWLAGMQSSALHWSQAGMACSVTQGPGWLHGSVDLSMWPPDTPQEYKSAPYGDRRQEIVFIGRNLNEAKLRKRLEQALVTDEEFQMGHEEWAKWPNPFVGGADGAAVAEQEPEEATTKSAAVNRRKRPRSGKNLQASSMRKRKQPPAAGVEATGA